MSNSVLSQPHPKGRNGRNGFDLSFHRSYTSPLGALLPIFWDFALPGDKYKLNTSTFVRTEPLEKAAFARFKHRVEWFFVPMQQLYSRWNEFYNMTDDVMSSLFTGNLSNGYVWPRWAVFPLFGRLFRSSITGFTVFNSASGNDPAFVNYVLDPFGVPKVWNFRRLWDMLGYGSLSRHSGIPAYGDDSVGVKEFFLLINFLAYHKIFHSHYLPTQWFENQPNLYNVDYYFSSETIEPSSSKPLNDLVAILSTLHYRPYRKDYFTNIMPSPLWNNRFANSIPGTFVSSKFSKVNFIESINPETYFSSSSSLGDPVNSVFNLTFPSDSGVAPGDPAFFSSVVLKSLRASSSDGFSTSDLRAMYAFDRILRVTAFAGSHYQDQVLAHYGVKVPEGISDEAYFLGSQVMDVQVSEVVATSSTGAMEDGVPLSGSTLGDLAGKGFGSSGKNRDVNFTCPCDGVIMGIQSIELIPDYSSMFMLRQNRYLTSLDFYHPEFDGLGMQPLVTDMASYDPSESNTVRGWQYRYSELKTNVDICNEGFWDTDRYNWSATKQSVLDVGSFQGDKPVYGSYFNFFTFPQTANNIFLKKYPFYSSQPFDRIEGDLKKPYVDGISSSQKCYENDPFLISMDIKAFKTSIMSVFSLDKVL